jgi:hypothetical protein
VREEWVEWCSGFTFVLLRGWQGFVCLCHMSMTFSAFCLIRLCFRTSLTHTSVIPFQIRTGEESDERGHIVVREFEDFVWLDHCLKTQNDISGVIVRLAYLILLPYTVLFQACLMFY